MLRLVPRITEVVRFAAEQGVGLGAEPETVFWTAEGRVTLCGAAPAKAGAGVMAWAEEHPAVGRRVGRYELLELIGEGGFAEVYRAREERPVRREVALKILKPGMDTRQVLARFAREREALARMSHRGIAVIFDAGATEAGRPWIAMELVPGWPVAAYCETRRLPLRERAVLMASICRAVQHGHEKGVVHRDLKPSNVLVAEVDGRPEARVIDFGIATATDPAGAGTVFTRTHQFMGSPCYMSPEQVDGRETDARTDVYALGAMWYELLTGEPPLTEAGLRDRGLREVIEQVLKEEAPHPADRVAGYGEDRGSAVAEARGMERGGLIRELEGGVSGIAGKALEKKPERRYPTVAAMADELEDWARGQPVAAPRLRRRAVRRGLRWLQGTALVAGLGAGTGFLFQDGGTFEKGRQEGNQVAAAPPWAVRHEVRSRAADGGVRPVALFQFDGDLRSALPGGPDLEAIGDPALAFKTMEVGGAAAQVMHGPRFLPSQWLKCENVIGINGPPEATESNRWTLVFDVMFPSITGPVGLFQCDSENRAVAELYVGPGGLGAADFGVQYGRIREGAWYRIVVTSSHSDRSQLYATWVNGARWGVPHVKGMHSAQFAFDDALLFFCEGNQRTGEFLVNSLAVYDVALEDHEIRALGAPGADGVPAVLHPAPPREVPGVWTAGKRLTPGDVRPGNRLGTAMAAAGEEAWTGSPGSDAQVPGAGAVVRWRRNEAGHWLPAGRLQGATPTAHAGLGAALSLTPLAGVAGAPQDAAGGMEAGAAWLFTRPEVDEDWQAARLDSPETGAGAGARFGSAVAMAGPGLAAVGAPGFGQGRGAVALYETATGRQVALLEPPAGLAGCGAVLAAAEGVIATTAAVTVTGTGTGTGTGVGVGVGVGAGTGTGEGGAILIFVKAADGRWSPVQQLDGPEGAGTGTGGDALAFSAGGDWLAAGNRQSGRVGLYVRSGGGRWRFSQEVAAPAGDAGDGQEDSELGAALAFAGKDRLLIGAPGWVFEGRRTGGVQLLTREGTGDSWRPTRMIVPEEGSQEGKFGAALAALTDGRTCWSGAPEDHVDQSMGGAVWAVPLPVFENQMFSTMMPEIAHGSAVAVSGGWAAVGTPGRDARAHGGTSRLFRRPEPEGSWEEAGRLEIPDSEEGSWKFSRMVFSDAALWTSAGGQLHRFRRDGGTGWSHRRLFQVDAASRLALGGDWLLSPQHQYLAAFPSAGGEALPPVQIPFDCEAGNAVAMAGGTAVVALRDDVREAAVFVKTGSPAEPWEEAARLSVPADRLEGRWFGRAVALDGDHALVGAPASGRSGQGGGHGKAWLFRRTGTGWVEIQALESPLPDLLPDFGSSVALSGHTALVGSHRRGAGLSHGLVEVFRRDPAKDRWHHDRTLEASNAGPGDGFGIDLALDGAAAIVGSKAPWAYFFRLSD